MRGRARYARRVILLRMTAYRNRERILYDFD
jgi:hypothetical protein